MSRGQTTKYELINVNMNCYSYLW